MVVPKHGAAAQEESGEGPHGGASCLSQSTHSHKVGQASGNRGRYTASLGTPFSRHEVQMMRPNPQGSSKD